MSATNTHRGPTGLLRLVFRIPVYVYRLGLGWLFGKRLVLINHVGRKTGTPRQIVLEVVERDLQTGTVTVVADYGPQSQWYQNLKAHPETTIQIGRRKLAVDSEFLSPEEGADIITRYYKRYGKLANVLFSVLGYQWDGTEQGAWHIALDTLRFVRFRPKG